MADKVKTLEKELLLTKTALQEYLVDCDKWAGISRENIKQVEILSARNAELERIVATLKETLQDKINQLVKMESSYSDITTTLAETRTELSNLRIETDRLHAENVALKAATRDLTQEHDLKQLVESMAPAGGVKLFTPQHSGLSGSLFISSNATAMLEFIPNYSPSTGQQLPNGPFMEISLSRITSCRLKDPHDWHPPGQSQGAMSMIRGSMPKITSWVRARIRTESTGSSAQDTPSRRASSERRRASNTADTIDPVSSPELSTSTINPEDETAEPQDLSQFNVLEVRYMPEGTHTQDIAYFLLPTADAMRFLESIFRLVPGGASSPHLAPSHDEHAMPHELHLTELSMPHMAVPTFDFHPVLREPSEIISETMASYITSALPIRFQMDDWHLLYSTARHGISLLTFYENVRRDAFTLLVIRDSHGAVFGAFATERWHIDTRYYGTGECFLFTFAPEFTVHRWSHENSYFQLSDSTQLAMGGGGNFALYLDSDLLYGNTGDCVTFNSKKLTSTNDFKCDCIEVWGFRPST
eukprot:TRINITY_DN15171_c0_g1::TRINITY_DN15171_c0_g1_i1::g.30627::m.30627 TRINITY_DN15171_c0_g1::TRINITY_DN15171_c0_g1_i1::g.30627  ORF type:complete len:530 (-),score=86.80,sp/Q4V8B0/OXR1_RAT/39.52/6e-33,TLD/PF07534.11/9.6e-38,Mod_r/PF07200.8/0.0057,DUF4201/PF13870.1/0.029,Reo_sigmaC/PF04582.7/0.031,GLE1/PF07817.8/0.26,PCI_Csn8/PF10075.4/6.7e+02,PCI_Csn8/PF10075.4/0.49,FlaC_arch/PF05377.6/9.8e+02,FlaC_arch/PF05377.6/1.1,DUF972/PF06156.8/1.4e+03,DUF972/PF06156.8/0.51,Filament/PF00038.16/5.6 TRINITY_DN15